MPSRRRRGPGQAALRAAREDRGKPAVSGLFERAVERSAAVDDDAEAQARLRGRRGVRGKCERRGQARIGGPDAYFRFRQREVRLLGRDQRQRVKKENSETCSVPATHPTPVVSTVLHENSRFGSQPSENGDASVHLPVCGGGPRAHRDQRFSAGKADAGTTGDTVPRSAFCFSTMRATSRSSALASYAMPSLIV